MVRFILMKTRGNVNKKPENRDFQYKRINFAKIFYLPKKNSHPDDMREKEIKNSFQVKQVVPSLII